mmetsp:Transcript_18308/g.34020  ORF Transcript_18308/g.34020 Transcript_18308/m.34020 type:complete len:313 (+) Transcript_18308:171-1109(+)
MSFDIQLPRDSQIDTFAEKVSGIIDSSNDLLFDRFGRVDVFLFLGSHLGETLLFLFGNFLFGVFRRWWFMDRKGDTGLQMIGSQQRRDCELFSRTLAVCTGQNRCMDVQESIVVEEGVCRIGHGVPNSHGGSMNSSPGSQMSVFSHMFQRMCLLTHGIQISTDFETLQVATIDGTKKFAGRHGHFHSLSRTLTGNESPDKLKRCTRSTRILTLGKALRLFCVQDTLKRLTRRPIVEFHKQQLSLVGITGGPCPSSDGNGLIEILITGQNLLDANAIATIQFVFYRRSRAVQQNSATTSTGSRRSFDLRSHNC